MPTLLIHTGGTIGMVRTDQGFAPQEGVVEDAVREMSTKGDVSGAVDIRSLAPLIDSANAGPQDWNRITATISETYERYDGFVVTHGSDTLAYTAAACTFALQGLRKPVILTGAMRPLTVEGSDGGTNLRDALNAATTADPGVWVQFAGKLMHGARVSKTHSTDFDAFTARDAKAAPCVAAPVFLRTEYKAPRIAVLTVTPGLPGALFLFAAANLDGIVLRCFGSGTAPNSTELIEALKLAETLGKPVVAVTKCAGGAISVSTYAAGSVLRENGVIDGRDMTMEAAYVKLMHVLSAHSDLNVVKERMVASICGES